MILNGVVESVTSVNSIEELQQYYPDHTLIERTGPEWEGWLWNGEFFTPPANETHEGDRRITRYAFVSRFTDIEAVGIDLASQGATVDAAMLRRLQQKIDAIDTIDLNNSVTRDGVGMLETAGLLVAGRAAEILDSPIQSHEVPGFSG